MFDPDIQYAADTVETAKQIVDGAIVRLSAEGDPDQNQVVAYDLAHIASEVEASRAILDYGAKGNVEGKLVCAFIADVVHDLASKTFGREREWDIDPKALDKLRGFAAKYRNPDFIASLAMESGPSHLDAEFEMVRDAFRRFATEKIAPIADQIHRENGDIPEDIISGLAEMGVFGLSIPEEFGGFASNEGHSYTAMIIATEELSRASLGAGGSLITRPEILARALIRGGTIEQKNYWLPKLATAEVLAAVAVTEPDFGSDVANLTTMAIQTDDGWLINGVKTWCTFAARADVLMLLARTDPDRSKAHKGLSLFIVEKPRGDGKGFLFNQNPRNSGTAGRMEGRPIETIGYRGMHSYEISFENWWVPSDALVGLGDGLGKGFYFQMEGFENGRVQTAARAVGVMQAAYEAAVDYANNRKVFGQPIMDYQLTQAKLGRMAAIIQASRQFAYHVANLMSKGEGSLEASMVKAYVCRAAEWVTREAMQIHGGMGYAEEFSVSRYFVDARVLSIFEGADETLSLKVIARKLLTK
ncbi:MAG: acyl-CoA/acyl-ACP dehydrogenase [Acidimicrobiaceae bacterium]|nr:acyl-CoA/acyl-ACP dehydrogenase [Acidimicrobiaceae bacterium]